MKYIKNILILSVIFAFVVSIQQAIYDRNKQLDGKCLTGMIVDKRVSSTRYGDAFLILIKYPNHSSAVQVGYASYYNYKVGGTYNFPLIIDNIGMIQDYYDTKLMSNTDEWLSIALFFIYILTVGGIIFSVLGWIIFKNLDL